MKGKAIARAAARQPQEHEGALQTSNEQQAEQTSDWQGQQRGKAKQAQMWTRRQGQKRSQSSLGVAASSEAASKLSSARKVGDGAVPGMKHLHYENSAAGN